MNKYEVLYILWENDEAAREGLIERFSQIVTAGGGEVTEVNKWGMRKLAYPIKCLGADRTEGYYVLMNYTSDASLPLELERNMNISDNVMRFMTVKKED